MNEDIRNRPSVRIYCREDAAQVWRECETPYELGYEAAQADIAAGLPEMTRAEHDEILSADYAEGYFDAYFDHAFRMRVRREREAGAA